jgi:hypothetical protein
MKNAVFWDVTPYGSYKNRHFGGTQRLRRHGTRIIVLGTILAVIDNRHWLRRNTEIEESYGQRCS